MSYAIRKDGFGWRSVGGPDEVGTDEIFSLVVPEPTDSQVKAFKWTAIKAERDRRTEQGGVIVDGRWFDTDTKSALRYKYLADLAQASGAQGNTVIRTGWRLMDVSTAGEIDMTYDLLKRVMAAGVEAAMAIDDAAQAHKAAMEASADPALYDFSGGWPQVFGE